MHPVVLGIWQAVRTVNYPLQATQYQFPRRGNNELRESSDCDGEMEVEKSELERIFKREFKLKDK